MIQKTTLVVMAAGMGSRFGTGHAIYCCKDAVKEPFAIVNADDYYGSNTRQACACIKTQTSGTASPTARTCRK